MKLWDAECQFRAIKITQLIKRGLDKFNQFQTDREPGC